MGMGSYRICDLFKRSLFLISLTWAPLALLAIVDNIHWIQSPGQNFFLDFTGYGQFILFLIAERISEAQTKLGGSPLGPIVSFVVGAPLLFTVPLFMFTQQLYEAKTDDTELFQ